MNCSSPFACFRVPEVGAKPNEAAADHEVIDSAAPTQEDVSSTVPTDLNDATQDGEGQ